MINYLNKNLKHVFPPLANSSQNSKYYLKFCQFLGTSVFIN